MALCRHVLTRKISILRIKDIGVTLISLRFYKTQSNILQRGIMSNNVDENTQPVFTSAGPSNAARVIAPSLEEGASPDAGLSIHEQIRQYYGQILSGSDDLKTNACCCSADTPPRYVLDVMPLIADEIIERFYGCGSPIPPALEGATVVDLGCGTGRDVYVLSKLVGETGRVIGVDMTPSQLEVAEKYRDEQAARFGQSASNVTFLNGYIEDLAALGIKDNTVDLVVSNCVINLTPFKEQTFREIYRVLKPGGELYFSDVFCDRRLAPELQNNPLLRGECLGGALYIGDFEKMMTDAGWPSFVYTAIDDIHVGDLALETLLGFVQFTSRTVRAIKAEGLEAAHENYEQTARYLGTMPELPRYFDLTDEIRAIKGRKVAISANMACMIEQSRYGKHFEISARGAHTGRFDFTRAQAAVDARRAKTAVDLDFVRGALARIGAVPFDDRVNSDTALTTDDTPQTMQVNITYACNLACNHCYLQCGPTNKQTMSREIMQAALDAFDCGGFKIMDITGGSPELHPDFEWFLQEAAAHTKAAGGYTIVRTNLTLLENPKFAHLPQLFADLGVYLSASLPYFDPKYCDDQRGEGVFKRAVKAIRTLNDLGYGQDPALELDLVYNVAGPFLPPPQELLEDVYRAQLEQREGVTFSNLYAFNNYPLGRFAQALLDAGMYDDYLKLLTDNFNALAAGRIMCKSQVNIDVDGRLYDCEVNHVLELPIQIDERDATVSDLCSATPQMQQILRRRILTHPICYSCAAGSGSSCGGALV
jgi:radical SAM/Cys-rich protein